MKPLPRFRGNWQKVVHRDESGTLIEMVYQLLTISINAKP
jgi:hypothetical protein